MASPLCANAVCGAGTKPVMWPEMGGMPSRGMHSVGHGGTLEGTKGALSLIIVIVFIVTIY